jgi:hypothetical protein
MHMRHETSEAEYIDWSWRTLGPARYSSEYRNRQASRDDGPVIAVQVRWIISKGPGRRNASLSKTSLLSSVVKF